MVWNKVRWIQAASIFAVSAVCHGAEHYAAPEGMVPGGQSVDRVLPVELNAPLRSDVCDADNVLPWDVLNGLEDQEKFSLMWRKMQK